MQYKRPCLSPYNFLRHRGRGPRGKHTTAGGTADILLLLTFKDIFTETARDYRLPPRCEIFAVQGLWIGSYLQPVGPTSKDPSVRNR
jgi:hypothetical protein